MIGDTDQAFAGFPAEFESQIPDRWQGEIEREPRSGDERRGAEYESRQAEDQPEACPSEMQEPFPLEDGDVVQVRFSLRVDRSDGVDAGTVQSLAPADFFTDEQAEENEQQQPSKPFPSVL